MKKEPKNIDTKTDISSNPKTVINATNIIEISDDDDVFDTVNLTTMTKTQKPDKSFYLFHLENEFGVATYNSGNTNSTYLNAFVEFSNKETTLLPEIDLFCLLTKWGALLKMTKIT